MQDNFLSDSLISWYKDDNKIAENLTYSFRLRFATREDAGYYHCIVKTAYGGVRSRKIKLEVGYLDPPSDVKLRSFIEVTLGQAIVIWPGSVQTEQQKQSFPTDGGREPWKPPLNSINETRKTTLSTYYLQAVPFPQAIWTINNAPLPNTLNIFVSQLEQAIVLLNIDREMDSKVIRARLVNGYGNANDGVFSQTHIIQVKDPPVNMAMHSLDLVLPPKDASLVLKDDHPGMAIFECVFNASTAVSLILSNLQTAKYENNNSEKVCYALHTQVCFSLYLYLHLSTCDKYNTVALRFHLLLKVRMGGTFPVDVFL
ncbi:unnamed protein product [Heterobilharzia americana]|nr:unnamed protein product [Heterobilharzia americana]